MRYAIILLPALLLGCSSDSATPVNPLAIVPQVSEPVTEPTDDDPVAVPAPAPVPEPVEVQQPEPVVEIGRPEPIDLPDDEVAVEPVAVEDAAPESQIEGLWYCKQFGEDFTWELMKDRTIVQHNPGVFYGVIGTYWHLEGEKFALGYTSGGIAEFTCDGETMNAGAMTCSRTPIFGD